MHEMHSHLYATADWLQSTDISRTLPVKKLDDFCQAHGVLPDVLKCDVEGAELLVFRGGQEVLAAAKPVIFVELLRKWTKKFNYHPRDKTQILAQMGFECYAIGDSGSFDKVAAMDDNVMETNFLFLHLTKHEAERKMLLG